MQQQTTSMFLVRFPAGLSPRQVDDFPKGTPRSCEGALHLRPSSTKTITPHEAAHLESLGIGFQKLKKIAPPPAAGKVQAPAPAPVAAAPTPTPPEPVTESREGRKKNKGGGK